MIKRCKHEYIMVFCEGKIEQNNKNKGYGVQTMLKMKCGCVVFCHKCGKKKKKLSKKIGEICGRTKLYNQTQEIISAINSTAEIKKGTETKQLFGALSTTGSNIDINKGC